LDSKVPPKEIARGRLGAEIPARGSMKPAVTEETITWPTVPLSKRT